MGARSLLLLFIASQAYTKELGEYKEIERERDKEVKAVVVSSSCDAD